MVGDFVRGGLRSTADLLFRRQASIATAASIIIVLSLASRILGVIRLRLWAGEFGSNSPSLAAFLAAFKIPDAVFQIIVLGALTTAFIPVISEYLTKRQQDEAARVFSTVVTYAMGVTAIFTMAVFILAHPVADLLTSGLSSSGIDLTAQLIRILMIGQFFLIASSFITGVLNSYHRFLIPALAPIFYNLGIILGSVVLSPHFGIYGPVIGVLIGAAAHLAIQIPQLRNLGVHFRPSLKLSPGVKEVGRLLGPRTFAMAVAQIDTVVDIALAAVITSSSAATNIIVYTYALALQSLPSGVFGYALGVASLPTLSREFAQENLENFKTTLIASLHQIMYLVIPSVAILVVLRIPIVRLIFGAPGFDWNATKLTAFTLMAFSVGIVGQSAIQLLARGFYALHDTATPVKITIVTVILNVSLAITFVALFNNVIFLGLSSTIGGVFSAVLLLYFLSRKVGGFGWRRLLIPIIKMSFAGLLAGIALYTPLKILDASAYGQLWVQGSLIHTIFGPIAIDTSHTLGLFVVTVISGTLGLLVYFLVTYVLGVEETAIFTKFFERIHQARLDNNIEEAVVGEPFNTPN